jgi:hypothetical protein
VQVIEREFNALGERYDKHPETIPGEFGQDKSMSVTKMVHGLLRERLSDKEVRQLAASCDALPVPVEDSAFATAVLAFMVKSFGDMGDRESLVGLLSTRCPSRLDVGETVELGLAADAKGLKDPILILGEAYAKCRVPETRHVLAAAVRRGFAGLGIRGKGDPDFVRDAMRWYEKERDHLAVNNAYRGNDLVSPTVETFERHPELYDNPPVGYEPLFVRKRGLFTINGQPPFVIGASVAVLALCALIWLTPSIWRRLRRPATPGSAKR